MIFISHNKKFLSGLFLSLLIFGLFFGFVNKSLASLAAASPGSAADIAAASEAAAAAAKDFGVGEAEFQECLTAHTMAGLADSRSVLVLGFGTISNLSGSAAQAIIDCQLFAAKGNAALINATQQLVASQQAATAAEKQTWRDVLAGAWKAMWSQFSKQLAYDTATWVASGGRGQQPLFVTEGWDAYLKNIGDEAVGAFIDDIDKRWGIDLCRPSFAVEILLKTSLVQPKRVSCRFSQMIQNWESAIRSADFRVEYVNALRPGENDISTFLTVQTGIIDKARFAQMTGLAKLTSTGGWKDLVDKVGKVLTPGTTIKAWLENKVFPEAGEENKVFVGSIYDFIETFLNTLVAQLLNNLKTGFFKDGGGGGGEGFNLSDLASMINLRNPEAAPQVTGIEGAKERFAKLTQNEFRTGGPYDILAKLAQCSDSAKTNLGPTDCVMDQLFAQEVRDLTMVKDLPEAIKNRKFAPPINQVSSLTEVFTLRNIVILRKYRIVPVGWEIAARKLASSANINQKVPTLGELIAAYDSSGSEWSQYSGLINPNWVLKAPELFCRREGYGEQNTMRNEQGASLSRSTYCADEQQCLKEDAKGNCLAYGYCTEEKPVWDLKGKECDPLYNTCQTFRSRAGETISYLANTVDFGNCNAQNAGCLWYSRIFNPISDDWANSEPEKVLKTSPQSVDATSCSGGDCTITIPNTTPPDDNWKVDQWKTVSANSRLVMSSACAKSGGCLEEFVDNSCTIPKDGIKCRLTVAGGCVIEGNALSSFNGDFSDCSGWNADKWSEGYLNGNNKHACALNLGRSNNVLELQSANNATEIVSTLPGVTIKPSTKYTLSFWAKKTETPGNNGSISVLATFNDGSGQAVSKVINLNLSDLTGEWQEKRVENIDNGQGDEVQLSIITAQNTTGFVYLDDFVLAEMDSACLNSSAVWVNLGAEDNPDADFYFDRDAGACDGRADGCSQFIRTKEGLGSNLIKNSSFEYDEGWTGGVRIQDHVHSGDWSVKGSAVPNQINSSQVFNLSANKKYILSAFVFAANDGAPAEIKIGSFNTVFSFDNESIGEWQRINKIFDVGPVTIVGAGIQLIASSNNVWFDDIKLEEVAWNVDQPTAYTDYNPSQRPVEQIAYLRMAPDDYNYKCYRDENGDWPTDATSLQTVLSGRNAACAYYAPVCIQSEVGCEAYRPNNGDPIVPGVISSADVCPAECVGYQTYKQEATNFVRAKYRNFIADQSARYCSAAAAGCDEFTNLDEVARGGEAKEYYSALQVCQKPGSDEQTYYTWEGSDTTGYQLKVFSLKKSNTTDPDSATGGYAPCTNLIYPENLNGQNQCQDPTSAKASEPDRFDYGVCTKDDMTGTIVDADGDPATTDDITVIPANPDCREFYDTSGNVHYRLLSKTIVASDNCHPYRRTKTQETALETQEDCQASSGYFNSFNECIYMAIPQGGNTCSLAVKGCREYKGNRGNNVRNIFTSNFESGAGGWENGTISSEATYPGGSSLSRTGGQLTRTVTVYNNRAYTLSFWAKGGASFALTSVRFDGASNPSDFFAFDNAIEQSAAPTAATTAEWKRYDLGPVFVTWGSGFDSLEQKMEFNIPVGQTLYIDNVILKEVRQSVYAIENSWFTPVSCDNTIENPTGTGCLDNRCNPYWMLGCATYRNRASQVYNLKSFESLCRPDAVGCEALIDTKNFDSPFGQVYNEGDDPTIPPPPSKITVPADELIYLVNDAAYGCPEINKGCRAFGLPQLTAHEEVQGFGTVYLKSQPDRYGTDLCRFDEVFCEEFAGRSLSYFKSPGEKVCEYDKDEKKWLLKDTGEECPVALYQTIGTGDREGKLQPRGWFNNFTGAEDADYQGWAGACPNTENSCAEFIDPLSKIYTNLVYNGDFEETAAGGFLGWTNVTPAGGANRVIHAEQKINLDTQTLYTLSADVSGDATLSVGCDPAPWWIWTPDESMTYEDGNMKLKRNVTAGESPVSGRFYIDDAGDAADCDLIVDSPNGYIDDVKIAPAGVYYQLAEGVDRSSCNGLVDFNNGCVLFNERGEMNLNESDSVERARSYLTFDADTTNLTDRSTSPTNSNLQFQNNANTILKVTPDRACYSWLYCTTYEKSDPNDKDSKFGNNDRCLDLGLCTALGKNGQCRRFKENTIPAGGEEAITIYEESDTNKSGYARLGSEDGQAMGFYPFEQMKQVGQTATVVNGNFESVYSDNTELPVGWSLADDEREGGWSSDKFQVGIDASRRKEGASYLQLNANHRAMSEMVEVENLAGTGFNEEAKYILSGWVNTLDLHPTEAQAEILIQELSANGRPLPSNYCDEIECSPNLGIKVNGVESEDWVSYGSLRLASGRPWTHLSLEIPYESLHSETRMLKIMLANYLDKDDGSGGVCGFDWNKYQNKNCDLGGFSLFDNIELKPVLDVRGEAADYVNRSCRLYPTQDSYSCKYVKDGKLLYGWYGYCLLSDPQNPNICLQWWPVDQIQGETLDEVNAYSGTRPLYQCLSADIEGQVKYGSVDVDLDAESMGDLSEGTGTAGQTQTYSIPTDKGPVLGACIVNLEGGESAGSWGTVSFTTISGKKFGGFSLIRIPIASNAIISISCGFYNKLAARPLPLLFHIVMSAINSILGNLVAMVGEFVGENLENALQEFIHFDGPDSLDCSEASGFFAQKLCDFLNTTQATTWQRGCSDPSCGASTGSVFSLLQGASTVGCLAGFCGVDEPIKDVSITCIGPDGGNMMCEFATLAVPYFYADHISATCQDLAMTVNSAGINKGLATRISGIGQGNPYKLLIDAGQRTYDNGEANPFAYYSYSTLAKPYGSFLPLAGSPEDWDGSGLGGRQPVQLSEFDFANRIMPASLGGSYNFEQSIDPLLTFLIGQCSESRNICADPVYLNNWQVPACPLKDEECLLFDREYWPAGTGGSERSIQAIKNIFAQSYGSWVWDNTNDVYKLEAGMAGEEGEAQEDRIWSIPPDRCNSDEIPSDDDGNPGSRALQEQRLSGAVTADGNLSFGDCYVDPTFKKNNTGLNQIWINDQFSTDATLNPDEPGSSAGVDNNDAVKLSFNTFIDPDQLPIKSYTIDWGDSKVSSVAGVNLRTRGNINYPFVLYHSYNYYKLKDLDDPSTADDGLICGSDEGGIYCAAKITVWVRDNWDKSAHESVWIKVRE